MSEITIEETLVKAPQMQPVDDSISPLDYLIVFLKRKKLILIVTFAFAVIAAVISLRMPEVYKAETRLLQPQNKAPSMASMLLSQFDSVAGAAGSSNALYVSLLYSRSILDGVVERFNLVELYGVGTEEDARGHLKNNIYANYSRASGIIKLTVENVDPEVAADLANAFVDELRKLTKRLATTEAAQRRIFFGEQLKDAKELLIKAEEEMANFQAQTGILKIDEQAKAVIEAISRIKAKIADKEVQLTTMRTYSTSNNPDLQIIEGELSGLKAELRKLSKGRDEEHDSILSETPVTAIMSTIPTMSITSTISRTQTGPKKQTATMSTEKMPGVSTEYIRKLRELKYSESLYKIFLKQYEAAKLDEARELLLVQVLDRAIPPETRASPKRTRIVVIGACLGFIFSIFMALVLEYSANISLDPTHREKLKMLKKYASIRLK